MARRIVPLLLGLALIGAPVAGRADQVSCDGTLTGIQIATVRRTQCVSDALGGATFISYFVPAACTSTSRCPVLYLLHGFGGSDSEMTGTDAARSAYVRALYEEPVTHDTKPSIPMIIVAPEGRTVAQTCAGSAPPAGQESFWVDWNENYWDCPPKFETHVIDELIGLVDRSFPTIASRDGRAIDGVSLGGFGAFKLAFQHPDLYANAGSISGALNILVAPDVQPVGPGPAGYGGAPFATTYIHGPRVAQTPPFFPFGDPFGAFGDPVADEAYFRGNNPLDLAINAKCDACLPLRFFSNDTIPRYPSDFSASYPSQQALEDVVLPMNAEMQAALTQHGVPFTYELHPGLHSGKYWDPHVRAQLEWHYAHVSHPGAPIDLSPPASFTYRSIRDTFSVWGWSVNVSGRDGEEFLTLWDADKDGLTVTGSGTVTITTPPLDITGISVVGATGEFMQLGSGGDGHGFMTFTIAPQGPTDEHAGSSGLPGGAGTVRICFEHPGDPPQSCEYLQA